MSTIFPKRINCILPVIFLTGAVAPLFIIAIIYTYFSPKHTDVGYQPDQPIPYSHKLHAGDLGIDCRYCHVNVDKSPVASIPPAQICMNCHSQIKTKSKKLAPLFNVMNKSIEKNGKNIKNPELNKPIKWVRIHNIPDYAYFDHSIHVNGGVSCVECHGRVDKMEIVRQVKPLSMGWCLDCHRKPESHIRPKDKITDLNWKPKGAEKFLFGSKELEVAKSKLGKKLLKEYNLNPPQDCSACHR